MVRGKMSIIQFREANCKNCYRCIRTCQVKSIAFRNEQAEIIEKECILCGHCFLECPQNAKSIKSDVAKVKEYLKKGEKVYVSIAPSYVGVFKGVNIAKMSAALKRLGFAHVEEAAIGAAQVSMQYGELLQKQEMKNIITTSCPTTALLVERHYPELIPYLAPVVSPMMAHCRMMRQVYGPRIKVVFIGPCISKKFECEDVAINDGSLNRVLMFEELRDWFEEEGICVQDMDEDVREMRASLHRLYPIPGGIIRTINRDARQHYKNIAVDGMENCIEALRSLRDEDLSGFFIEMSACPGSCLGGPGMKGCGVSYMAAKDAVIKNAASRVAPASAVPLTENTKANFRRRFIDRSVERAKPSEQQIQEILNQTGKTTPDKHLNCGSCGYLTCRDKAIAVFEGKADVKMCVPYMREKAESISNVVIDNTPNGIIILDKDLKVLEYNPAAATILKLEQSVVGERLPGIIGCDKLQAAWEKGENSIDEKVYYPELDVAVEQSIVCVKENAILIVLMKDITKENRQNEKIGKMRQETVDIAQKVIEKQMRVAQEIASLLGETTAETKLALTTLKKSISVETDGV